MALRNLKELRLALLNQMLKKISVNNQFEHLMIAKRSQNPQSVISTIGDYCDEAGAILSQMKNVTDISDVEFSHLATLCKLLKEKSTRICVVQMNFACMLVIQACEQRNKIKFFQALDMLENDFSIIQSQLEAYARIERRIIMLETDQAGGSSS
ncbi:hypothetical protein HAX54_016930 [Datura stramonium]|uniref:Histidine-containing phosphotransfer protein n=1 Tax=Datura stramonium TaxID=4076 RepID=A0ABS8RJ84_DATST|nr:hypothetical protein [Datura stramonium]